MAGVYFHDATTEHKFKSRAANFNNGTPAFFSVAYLNKSGSSWGAQQLLICHVIATKKRDNCLPDFDTKEPFKLNPDLSEKAKSQIDNFINGPETEDPAISKHYLIQQFINGPGDEDPGISKHYLVGKYGTNLREIWAALATVTVYKHKQATIITPATSSQSTSPSKRHRRNGPAPKYYSSDSHEPGMSRQDINISDYMEQFRTKAGISNPSSSPHKRPRRSIAPAKYNYADSDDSSAS
ncbi:hypothetical protein FBULB1_9105 [Fusarium bulbicola]|nr:hypothetical protein FBULB1_9105 [Fusarium bulbicola]